MTRCKSCSGRVPSLCDRCRTKNSLHICSALPLHGHKNRLIISLLVIDSTDVVKKNKVSISEETIQTAVRRIQSGETGGGSWTLL
jgi:hypothetical protein